MKGIILAGGTGSRLLPLTKVTNKHLLPVYNKPMIYYPIEFLRDSGISEIMIILGGNSVGDFINLLGDGGQFDVSITYRYQYKPDGIAGALKLAKEFCGEQPFAVCLGDNIFGEPIKELKFKLNQVGAVEIPSGIICIHPTDRPGSFGVPTFCDDKIIKITEKPINPDSNYAVTGLYIYDKNIWLMIDSLVPSKRGELEITDINNWYINNGKLECIKLNSWWHDAGSIYSLFKASQLVMEKERNVKK
jgi:glucose-1-phosphate thymidylyltransferase